MHTYDSKKWKSSLTKRFFTLPLMLILISIYALSIFEKISFTEFVVLMWNSFSGIIFLFFAFAFILIFFNWNSDRRERTLPKLNVNEDCISRLTGVIEERVYIKDIQSYEVNRKGKSNESITINLVDGQRVLIEQFFPISEIEHELAEILKIARR